ncbi:unnamed protein product [Spirodela intermedia]|uniref:Mitochondrial import inner membrane translocase subunit n=1 Tax=Spirodela intermedia TaxID=51605 RepID=A0A7I8J9L9_SPIIN|nr:unnamed protein product [Spirodela intermedia]CAA6666770.1 unnamed protein product [Spirodela intermedia]
MDPFTSSPSSSGLPSSSGPSSDVLMNQLKVQLAQAYAEEFLETVRSKCFTKCITKPGSSLSGSESSCISRCVERYIEATGIVGRALFSSTPAKLLLGGTSAGQSSASRKSSIHDPDRQARPSSVCFFDRVAIPVMA